VLVGPCKAVFTVHHFTVTITDFEVVGPIRFYVDPIRFVRRRIGVGLDEPAITPLLALSFFLQTFGAEVFQVVLE